MMSLLAIFGMALAAPNKPFQIIHGLCDQPPENIAVERIGSWFSAHFQTIFCHFQT